MPHLVRFDGFELDFDSRRLRKRGLKIKLPYQCFEVLACLLDHPGCAVSREDLRRRLWRDEVFVDFDNNLNILIARLRELLCDSAEHPRFIETLPRYGYRFIGEVQRVRPEAEAASAKRVRLLVLPFVNLSGDASQEYFSDAMTDEVITALASLAPGQLAVIARTTAMHYKGSHKDVAHIGRELNVDCVVEGGVLRWNDRVGVNVQLIQTSDQAHLFAQKYDAQMRDIFSLHSCIAQAIIRHVPAIADGMRQGAVLHEHVRRRPTEDLAAYNEYIKGRYHIYRLSAEGNMEAKRHFEAALARDPRFALACNALAEQYWYLGICGFAPSRETDLIGRSYTLRSLEIDPESAETHALLSFFPTRQSCPDEIDYYDWEQIQNSIARARELDPTPRLVRLRYAMILAELGDPSAAAAELEIARESDPLSLDVNGWLVLMLALSRQYERALEHGLRVRELEPEHFVPYDVLGQVYLAMQRYDESAATFRKGVELSPGLPFMLGWLGLALGLAGRGAEARATLARLHELARERYVLPTAFAWTHLGLGEFDEAFLWLDRAVDAPDRMLEGILSYSFYDRIRGDPRFRALLRKMNLES